MTITVEIIFGLVIRLKKSHESPGYSRENLRDSKKSTRKVLDIPGKAQRFQGKY